MTDYEGRYEGNGEDLDNYGSSPQPRGSSHGGADDYSDSKSQVYHRSRIQPFIYNISAINVRTRC